MKFKEALNGFKNLLQSDDKIKTVTELPVNMGNAVVESEKNDEEVEAVSKEARKNAEEFVRNYANRNRKPITSDRLKKMGLNGKMVENLKESYSDEVIYQFPRFTPEDRSVARREYNLEIVRETKEDTFAKGSMEDIEAFADEYLGYELNDDYFIYESCGKKKKGLKESRKPLNEGPGAGYTIESKGYDLDGYVKSAQLKSTGKTYTIDCKVDFKGTVDTFEASGYYAGTGEVHNLNIKCDHVVISELSKDEMYELNFMDEEFGEELNEEAIGQYIKDTLSDASYSFVYGGGWSHSLYDGEVVNEDDFLDLYYVDIKAYIYLADQRDIDQVDRMTQGYGYEIMYEVVTDDGYGEDAFEDKEEAIEYAKKYGYYQVREIYVTEDWEGNEDIETADVVWEREEDEDDMGESLKRPTRKSIKESTRSAKVYNPYNYTIQELRIDDDVKTFERGDFTMGKPDRKFKNRQEYEDFIDDLKSKGYSEKPSDYKSLRNRTRKGVPTRESMNRTNGKLHLDESLFNNRRSIREARATVADEDSVRELVLFAENDSQIYHSVTMPVVNNMKKKIGKGVFDEEKAVKAFQYVADAAAKKYKKDFEPEEDGTYDYDFNAATRREAAKELFDRYKEEIGLNESCGRKSKKSLKEENNPLDGIRSNVIEFPNGEYVYIGYEDGKLYAGGATNTGVFHEYEIDYDEDDSVDGNIQRLYDTIVEEKPELLEESLSNKSHKNLLEKKSPNVGVDVYTTVYDCLIGGMKGDEKMPDIADEKKRVNVDDFVGNKRDSYSVEIKTDDPETVSYVKKIADRLMLPVKESNGKIKVEMNKKTAEMPIDDFVAEMEIEPIKYVNKQYEKRKATKANK